MDHRGENIISFKISSDGSVLPFPQGFIQSTSWQMAQALKDIIPRAAIYIENLLRDALQKQGGDKDGKE